jgi:zinc protease
LLLGACAPAADETPEILAESVSPAKIFAMPYLMREMDNGLRVIIVQTEYPDIVTL